MKEKEREGVSNGVDDIERERERERDKGGDSLGLHSEN